MTAEAPHAWDDYSAGWAALHGGVDPRRSLPVVRFWLRASFLTGRVLVALRVSPGAVTAAGLILSMAVPLVAVQRGWWLFAAAVLVLLAALADSADGAVALLSRRATRLGAFQDSVADRLTEALWLLALWRIGAPGILVVGCGGLAWLHEYMRARATVAGMAGVGVVTLAERPTRVITVIAALVLAGLAWLINPDLTPGAVTVVLAVWGVLGVLGGLKLAGAIRTALRS